MEDRKITEKESLNLISDMIQQSRDRLNIGSGNAFLVWGYICVIVGLVAWYISGELFNNLSMGAIHFKNAHLFVYLWIPILGCVINYNFVQKKTLAQATTKNYIDRMIETIWTVIGYSFLITTIMCCVYLFEYRSANAAVFFPLGLILPGMGISMTGFLIKEKCITYSGFIGVACGAYRLFTLLPTGHFTGNVTADPTEPYWGLIFSACYLLMMVIPGHYINYRARKEHK